MIEFHGAPLISESVLPMDIATCVDDLIRERCLSLLCGHEGGRWCRCICHEVVVMLSKAA